VSGETASESGRLARINRGWSNFIYWLITLRRGVVLRVGIVTLFVTTSVLGAYWLAPQKEYLPEGNRNLVFGILIPPPGYNLDKMMAIGNMVEADLAKYWETDPGTAEARELGVLIDNFFFVARGRMLFMGARSVDPLQASKLIPILNRAASKMPAVFVRVSQSSLFDSALSGGRYIDVQITGPDLDQLYAEARALYLYDPNRPGEFEEPILKHFPAAEGHQAVPVMGLDLTSPELHVIPQWEKAAELGLTAVDLGYAVDALVDGAYAGDYWHEGDKIDLVIYGSPEYMRYSQDIDRLPIATPSGNLVPVSAVADVVMSRGPDQIEHIERQRAVTLQIKPAPEMPLETAMEIVNNTIRRAAMQRPNFSSGLYQIRIAGTADKLAETAADLQWNLLLAFVITYLLMAALFESFLYPVVIMISVMLALVGGFFGLWLLNLFIPQALDMLTMLGFVILIGTVVNNAILIVHQSLNYMRDEQIEPRAAIRESVRTRVRPIFMSTLTTVLGMLPLVVPLPSIGESGIQFVAGAGSELYRGLGSVVLGGLMVSTIFTLLLVPIGFSLAIDLKEFITRSLLGRLPAELDVSAAPEQQPAT
jgi:hydrophobic/amphiphilic exporter-1 (mainly G- bacteria), HAE1 family